MTTLNKPYYETHVNDAVCLVQKQKADGWMMADIRQYWYALGYDIFFIRSVVDRTLRGEAVLPPLIEPEDLL